MRFQNPTTEMNLNIEISKNSRGIHTESYNIVNDETEKTTIESSNTEGSPSTISSRIETGVFSRLHLSIIIFDLILLPISFVIIVLFYFHEIDRYL